jgi:hypothetical protein
MCRIDLNSYERFKEKEKCKKQKRLSRFFIASSLLAAVVSLIYFLS